MSKATITIENETVPGNANIRIQVTGQEHDSVDTLVKIIMGLLEVTAKEAGVPCIFSPVDVDTLRTTSSVIPMMKMDDQK